MINVQQVRGKNYNVLNVSYIKEDGNIGFREIMVPQSELFKWELTNNPQYADSTFKYWMNNRPVRKRPARSLDRYRMIEFLSQQSDEIQSEIFSIREPRKYFFDIEVEVTDEWPDVKIAQNALTTIALVTPEDDLVVFGLKELPGESDMQSEIDNYIKDFKKNVNFQYIQFDSEYAMLKCFLEDYVTKIPMLTGWNSVDFDWMYIFNRCNRIGLNPKVVSPSRVMLEKKMPGKIQNRFLPQHRLFVDYLEIYKKWDRSISAKENHTLDYTAGRVLGIKKVPYTGSLKELYQDDFYKYVFYNAIDTYLVKLIDEKLNTLNIFLTLGGLTHVENMKVFNPIPMFETVLVRECLKRNLVLLNDVDFDKRINADYEGAYVFPPKKGLSEYIAALDFASLYPFTQRQFNISPETYLFKDVNYVPKDNEIKTASGAVFNGDSDSVTRTILADYYGRRKAAKREMFEYASEIDQLEQLLKEKL